MNKILANVYLRQEQCLHLPADLRAAPGKVICNKCGAEAGVEEE